MDRGESVDGWMGVMMDRLKDDTVDFYRKCGC